MRHIGLLGGTFDPPHYGHLLIAEEVRIALNLDEIWFIPTYEPPHKQKARSSAAARMAMLEKAIKNHSAFKIEPIEIARQGTSYTYDTIIDLKHQHPDDQFYFIIGADMVASLSQWYRIDDLLKLMTFVAVKRQGFQSETSYPVIHVDIPMFDVSSTLIRNRIKTNQTAHFLLPQSVYRYIKEKQLYENI